MLLFLCKEHLDFNNELLGLLRSTMPGPLAQISPEGRLAGEANQHFIKKGFHCVKYK